MTRLTLKAPPPLRLSLRGILPEQLGGLAAGAIERLPLPFGKESARIGDWFHVDGAGDERLVIAGDCSRLDHIGAAMTRGQIVVEGAAGAYLGLGLAGGEIRVEGSAGYGAAADMRDGIVRIGGDAGDGLGAALPGSEGGMRGGAVIVDGRAGDQCGQRLRRGLIVIRGDAGAACGARMLAGTILLGGHAGPSAAIAMRHGTILALGGFARLAPTFGDCGVHELVAVRLLSGFLRRFGLTELAGRLGAMQRFLGDGAVGGKGELLIPG